MRFFFDTEFYDNGERIQLISIGISAEDGRTFYAEVETADAVQRMSAWLAYNVAPRLHGERSLYARWGVADAVKDFVGQRPEFWAYVADYDWVALSQLYGPLIARPAGWPWTALDSYQLPDFKRFVVKPANPHNALSDAFALHKSWDAWRAAYPYFPLPTHSSPRE